jgi:hypothetical protein
MSAVRANRFGVCVVCLCVAAWWFGGCKTVDPSLLDARDTGVTPDAGRDAATPPVDTGTPDVDGGRDARSDGSTCRKDTETCNGKDDDCDDKVDEGGDAWCEENVILHADALCEPMDDLVCFAIGCHDGYWSCDGDPRNGCEADYCDCHVCPDDAGVDDGG